MPKTTLAKILAALLVTALAVPAWAAEAIKLGVAGAHTGDLASYGLSTKDVAEMVVAEVNAKG